MDVAIAHIALRRILATCPEDRRERRRLQRYRSLPVERVNAMSCETHSRSRRGTMQGCSNCERAANIYLVRDSTFLRED